VTDYPLVEHGESRASRWLRERRLRIALVIGVVESILVLTSQIRWFWVLGLFLLFAAAYVYVRRRFENETLRHVAWTAAFSQVLPFVIPLVWGLVKAVAIVVLVIVALVAAALLYLDRR
jgi:hypothetical protein